MGLQPERQQRRGEPIRARDIATLQSDARAGRVVASADIVPVETTHGVALLVTDRFRRSVGSNQETLYGTAAADWTSGNTISLTPCDCEGTATGEAALDVACPWGDGNTVALAIVGGTADVAVTCKISIGTLLQYAYAADGTATLIGVPPTEIEYIRYDSATSHNLQLRVRFLFGTGRSTFSDWIDLMTSEESKKVSCDTPGS